MKRLVKRKSVHRLQAVILLAAIGAGGGLLGPLKAEADRRADILKNRLLGQLETDFGILISYDSISPALLSAVTIRNVEVKFAAGLFVADRVRVYYNPLRRKNEGVLDPLRMISRISVDDSHLNLALPEGLSPAGQNGSRNVDPWSLLADKTVVLTDLSADISIGDASKASADNVDLAFESDGDDVRYEFEGFLELDDARLEEKLGIISLEFGSDGIFTPSGGDANGRIDISAARTDIVEILPMSVDYTFADEEATIRRIDDQTPIDISAKISADNWSLSAVTERLKIGDIVSPGQKRADLTPWFSSVADGEFSITGSLAGDRMAYGANLTIEVPQGSASRSWKAGIEIEGDENLIRAEHLGILTEGGGVSYSGTVGLEGLKPQGILAVHMDEYVLGYPVAAEFLVETQGNTIAAHPMSVEAAGMEFHDFSFLIVGDDKTYAVSLLVVPEKPNDEAERRILVDALLELGNDPVIHGFVSIEGFEASHTARLAGAAGIGTMSFIADSKLDLTGFFEANRDSWVLSVEDAAVTQKGNPQNTVRFTGRAFPGEWYVDSLRISWNEYVVDGRISAGGNRSRGNFDGRFIIQENLYPIDGTWGENGSIDISSDFGLSVSVGARQVRGRSLRIAGDSLTLPLKEGLLIADVEARGRLTEDDWRLGLDTMRLAVIDRKAAGNLAIEARGSLGPGTVILRSVSFEDDIGILNGSAVVEAEDSGRSVRGRVEMDGIDGESYDLILSRNRDVWDVAMDVRSAELARFKRERLAGRVDAEGRLSGPLDNPRLTLNFRTRNGYLDGRRLRAVGMASMESGRMRIYNIAFDHEGLSLERGLAILDLNEGTFRSTAEINARFNQVPVSTGFSFAVDFRKGLGFTDLSELGKLGYTGTLATRAVLWDEAPHLPPFTFQFSRNDEEFRVRTPDGETLDIAYAYDSGRLEVRTQDPLPIAARGGGVVANGEMDVSFPELEIDPVLINYVMRRDPILLQYHVVFQDGRFIGNLDIEGPTGDADLYGRLRAQDLLVDTPYTYAEIRPASSDIVFEGNRITFEPLEIPVGDGIVYGRGYIVLERWSITDFDMHYGGMATKNGVGVPVYYPLLGLYMDGTFTGDVHMTGDGRRYFLDADLTFPTLKTWLGERIAPVSQRPPGKFPTPVFLDFNFITGNNCTFYLPNEQLKIVRATAEPGERVKLNFSTDPRNLSLTGVLPIKNGEIFYFDRDFQVTEGELRFNETQVDFDPILEFRAETKVRDETGDDVTVALVYNAPVMSDFNPSIETVPSRSEAEILALFGQAVVPYAEAGSTEAGSVLLATGGMFGQVGIVQPFEDVLKEGLNLDMVTIRTDIIENTLAEGLSRNQSTESTTPSSGLGRYLDNTSLYAGKYIGNALFLSGSLTASHLEGQRLRSVFGGLEFETEVSLEMETPFLNVAWSYSPDIDEKRNFVANNKISLKWQFTY